MTRFITTCLATTALSALPALHATAQSAEEDMPALCKNAFIPADTNEDSQVSMGEAQEQRRVEFGQLDANADGSIDREEYVACIGQAQKAARADAEKMDQESEDPATWDEVKTADDSLTAEDFMELAEKAWQDSPEAAGKVFTYNKWLESEEEYASAAVNRFNRQDTDNDGVLTKEEYETPARDMDWSEAAVTARFESLDADGNGAISPQEYAGAGARAVQPGPTGASSDTDGADAPQAQMDDVVVPVYVYYLYVI